MTIADKLTREQFREILLNTYKKGNESTLLEAKDLINKIKKEVILVMESADRRYSDEKII